MSLSMHPSDEILSDLATFVGHTKMLRTSSKMSIFFKIPNSAVSWDLVLMHEAPKMHIFSRMGVLKVRFCKKNHVKIGFFMFKTLVLVLAGGCWQVWIYAIKLHAIKVVLCVLIYFSKLRPKGLMDESKKDVFASATVFKDNCAIGSGMRERLSVLWLYTL